MRTAIMLGALIAFGSSAAHQTSLTVKDYDDFYNTWC